MAAMPVEKDHTSIASYAQDSNSLASSASSFDLSSSSKSSLTGSSSSKDSDKAEVIQENPELNVEHLGTVTSGLQFEPCRFPTAPKSLCTPETGFASIKVTECKDVLAHASSLESQIHLLKVAWALLLSKYVRDSYVAFGFIDGLGSDSDFTKAVVCSLVSGSNW